jgi:hypothetical protein
MLLNIPSKLTLKKLRFQASNRPAIDGSRLLAITPRIERDQG